MHLSELHDLLGWVEENLRGSDVVSAYETLAGLLENNVKPNAQKQPIGAAHSRLLDAVRAVPLQELSATQRAFLASLEIAPAIGPGAAEALDSLMFRENVDPATVSNEVDGLKQGLTRGLNKSTQIMKSLNGCWPEADKVPDGALARLSFKGRSAISDVEKLKDWSERIYLIGYGFAVGHGQTAQDVRVVRAGSGSIVFDLYAHVDVVRSIADTLLQLTQAAVMLATLREMKRQSKRAEVPDVEALLDEKIKERLEAGVASIGDAAVTAAKAKGSNANALRTAVKEMSRLLESDGEVDLILPRTDEPADDDVSPESVAQLRKAAQAYRQELARLKERKLLANPGTEEPDEQADGDLDGKGEET